MSFTLWVTSDCNLKCKYCYEGEKNTIKMNKKIVDDAISFGMKNFMKENEEKTFCIHGGEPFLEFDTIKYIVERIKHLCKDEKPTFLTTTNATILNDEILDFIINEMPDITVSLDGNKNIHDLNRVFISGKGSHDIALKNSLRLLEHLPNIRVRMTFNTKTVDSLFESVKYLIEKGFKVIVPAPDLFDKNWNYSHIKILKEQILLIKEYTKDKEDLLISIIDNTYTKKCNCKGGVNSVHIYPDGKLYPCILTGGIEEFCIGNIYDGIDTDKVSYFEEINKQKNPSCVGCEIYNYCDGSRCKIINKLINDNYLMPSAMLCNIENLKYDLI